MAVTASGTATGPRRRYAPEDPTLPKPWRGLVDLSTGYLYFWNPETNITQYERPASASSPPPTSKSESTLENPSVQFQQPSGSSIQDTGATCCHSQNALSGSTSAGYGAESVRSSGVYQPVDMGVGSSESYRRRHEITVIGNNVPAPFMTFQSTGFPSEILREVRYLLPGGANVVLCPAAVSPLVGLSYILGAPLLVGPILRGLLSGQFIALGVTGDGSL